MPLRRRECDRAVVEGPTVPDVGVHCISGWTMLNRQCAVFADVARLVQSTFPRSVRGEVRTDPDLGEIVGNATQLHQVLMNLFVNARDAMPGGGELKLATSPRRIRGRQHPGGPGDNVQGLPSGCCGLSAQMMGVRGVAMGWVAMR